MTKSEARAGIFNAGGREKGMEKRAATREGDKRSGGGWYHTGLDGRNW